jgi:hypothetical protein
MFGEEIFPGDVLGSGGDGKQQGAYKERQPGQASRFAEKEHQGQIPQGVAISLPL